MAKQRLKPKLTREEMNNQYLNSIFEEFMAEKKALGREPDTLKAYQVTFNEFYKYFGERAEETGDIVASMFIEWTNSMKDRGLRPATINHHLMGIRTFMYWCMDEERQYIDRFKIRLVRVQDEMPKEQARVFSQNHPPASGGSLWAGEVVTGESTPERKGEALSLIYAFLFFVIRPILANHKCRKWVQKLAQETLEK